MHGTMVKSSKLVNVIVIIPWARNWPKPKEVLGMGPRGWVVTSVGFGFEKREIGRGKLTAF